METTKNETTTMFGDQAQATPPFFCLTYEPTLVKAEPQENEPIDLTFNDRSANEFRSFPSNFPRRRRARRKLIHDADGKLYLVNESNNILAYETPEVPSKVEVMMSAKSLFSKRTRTLYHWMYPNASKQQIKLAVCSAWEALSSQEKDVYVAQVMAKFGFPQSNLMVNPQLVNIRELPPLPEINMNSKAYELQTAISSISDGGGPFANVDGRVRRRKCGRPARTSRGKKKTKNDSCSLYADLSQDFKDDPELSQELAQFAMFFKNKI